jgi:hypothetical protein
MGAPQGDCRIKNDVRVRAAAFGRTLQAQPHKINTQAYDIYAPYQLIDS